MSALMPGAMMPAAPPPPEGTLPPIEPADGDRAPGQGIRQLPPHIEAALLDMRQKFEGSIDGNRARREYVKKCLKLLEFFRGNQYTWWDYTSGSWRNTSSQTGGQLSNSATGTSQALYVVNAFQAYLMSFEALLTGNKLQLRAFPDDPNNPDDVYVAEKATAIVKEFQRTESPFEQNRKEVFALCVCGSFGSYIRSVTDGDRFGYMDEPTVETQDAQIGDPSVTCSLCGDSLNPVPVPGTDARCQQCGAPLPEEAPQSQSVPLPVQTGSQKIPRSKTLRSIVDGFELKLPFDAAEQAEFEMIVRSREVAKSLPRAIWPEMEDRIMPSETGNSALATGGDYERRVRRQSNLGTTTENRTTVTDDRDRVTLTEAWIRPRAFYGLDDKAVRKELLAMFPHGVKVTWCDDRFCEAREEEMDKVWRICHALPGRSQVREPLLGSLIPVQEAINDLFNIIRDCTEYTLPVTFVSSRMLDVKKWARSQVMAGATYNVTDIGRPVSDGFHQTEPGRLPEAAVALFDKLWTELAQFLTGLFPASYGGATPGNNALDVEVPVPTPRGFKRNGDLVAGDEVFGEDGQIYKILKAHPIRTDRAYRLTFDDGTSVLADAGHRWMTQTQKEREAAENVSRYKGATPRGRRLHSRQGSIKTTAQIVATLLDKRGRSNHAISVGAPFQMPDADLPLDPYILGVWLGDGDATGGTIAASESDGPKIAAEFAKAGFTLKKLKPAYVWGTNGLRTKLRTLGVLGDKHIPNAYLWASPAQRLALLQGLMDTDGCATIDGKQFFTNRNRALIDGVYHLAASLGCKPRILSKTTGPCVDQKTGKVYEGGRTIWEVRWTNPLKAFRLERKVARLKTNTVANKRRYRYIIAAEEAGSAEMRCITVSNPTSLYQFGTNFNVCANTAQGMEIQRQSALGRINVILQAVQEHYVQIAPLIVEQFVNNAIEPLSFTEENEGGSMTLTTIDPSDFVRGKYRPQFEVVSEFPTTWAQRQALLLQMFQMPSLQPWVALMKNISKVKSTLGLELEAPKHAAYQREWRLIKKILAEAPIPQTDPMTGQPAVDPMTGMPLPPKCSVQITPLDDNVTMLEALGDFIDTTEGMKVSEQQGPGWENLLLHVQDRQAAIAPPLPANGMSLSPSPEGAPGQAPPSP